jgi:ribosomal protein S19E (S16A)
MKLSYEELDALNMTENWFGGSINRMDLFVADIRKSVMNDLTDEGFLRKKFIGWEITRKGRNTLRDKNITHYTDTRTG